MGVPVLEGTERYGRSQVYLIQFVGSKIISQPEDENLIPRTEE